MHKQRPYSLSKVCKKHSCCPPYSQHLITPSCTGIAVHVQPGWLYSLKTSYHDHFRTPSGCWHSKHISGMFHKEATLPAA